VVDDGDRKAVVFQFELPAADLQPGLYTCQVNIIDEVAGRFAFPRLAVYVRPPVPSETPVGVPPPDLTTPPAG
jgi:hypothetical protein